MDRSVYITDIKHNDVRTEGLSYGMIIAVELNKKKEFDALWNWSATHCTTTHQRTLRLHSFSGRRERTAKPRATYIAPDGESYYAMALYFAASSAGPARGIYNYKQQADQLLTNMRHRAPVYPGKLSMLRGDGKRELDVTVVSRSTQNIRWFCLYRST